MHISVSNIRMQQHLTFQSKIAGIIIVIICQGFRVAIIQGKSSIEVKVSNYRLAFFQNTASLTFRWF